MVVLVTVLSVILVGLCAFVVFLILGQDVKGGGLAGALSGGSVQSALGSRTTETVLKLTGGLVVAIFLLVIVLTVLQGRPAATQGFRTEPPIENTPVPSTMPKRAMPEAPATPATPATPAAPANP